jgi:hypothetical protein
MPPGTLTGWPYSQGRAAESRAVWIAAATAGPLVSIKCARCVPAAAATASSSLRPGPIPITVVLMGGAARNWYSAAVTAAARLSLGQGPLAGASADHDDADLAVRAAAARVRSGVLGIALQNGRKDRTPADRLTPQSGRDLSIRAALPRPRRSIRRSQRRRRRRYRYRPFHPARLRRSIRRPPRRPRRSKHRSPSFRQRWCPRSRRLRTRLRSRPAHRIRWRRPRRWNLLHRMCSHRYWKGVAVDPSTKPRKAPMRIAPAPRVADVACG